MGVYLVILGFGLEFFGLELERLRDPDVFELDRLLDPDELELERLLDCLAPSDKSTNATAMKTRIRIVVIRIASITPFFNSLLCSRILQVRFGLDTDNTDTVNARTRT